MDLAADTFMDASALIEAERRALGRQTAIGAVWPDHPGQLSETQRETYAIMQRLVYGASQRLTGRPAANDDLGKSGMRDFELVVAFDAERGCHGDNLAVLCERLAALATAQGAEQRPAIHLLAIALLRLELDDPADRGMANASPSRQISATGG